MPDALTMKIVNKRQIEKWLANWRKKSSDTKQMMNDLSVFYLAQIFKTFRGQGARDGFPRWRRFSTSTLRTEQGTPKIRYGTDKRPKRTASQLREYKSVNNLWYKPGIMKGYEGERRYSGSSKLLQASGSFRNSFRSVLVTPNRSLTGTTMGKADKIIGDRPVIRVSTKDFRVFSRLMLARAVPTGSTT